VSRLTGKVHIVSVGVIEVIKLLGSIPRDPYMHIIDETPEYRELIHFIGPSLC
jgi:hypothetical protein